MILLSGDFRQTLSVIAKSTAADKINACLKSSSLWQHVRKLKLTTNMRVALQNYPTASQFSRQQLAHGYGQIPVDVSTELISIRLLALRIKLLSEHHELQRNLNLPGIKCNPFPHVLSYTISCHWRKLINVNV